MTPPLRALIYARVSKPGEKSVADQEAVGRRELAALGIEVVAVYSDKQSASRYRKVESRPGFIKAKEFIQAGNADLLWTFANNRAHRDLDDYTLLRRLCIETGTLWRYSGRTYDLSLPSDRRAANADALRAEEQGDDISEATRRGTAEALEDGRAHGKLPRGYRIVRDELTGKSIGRVAIPEQAAVIQEAARRVLAFETVAMVGPVARELEADWRKAGGRGRWGRVSLRAILINPTYAGLRTSKGVVVREGKWEPILSVADHEKLVALLTDPARLTHRGSEPKHWLSYIATCDVCKGPMSPKNAVASRPRSKPTYRCSIGHASRQMEVVDALVEDLLLGWLEDPRVAEKIQAPEMEGGRSLEEELAEIAQLQDGLVEWTRDAARQGLPVVVVQTYVAEVESKIRVVRARIDAREVDPLLSPLVGPGARDRWARMNLAQRRDVARACVKVEIRPRNGTRDPLGIEVFPIGRISGAAI